MRFRGPQALIDNLESNLRRLYLQLVIQYLHGDFLWENYREAIRSIPLAGAFCLRAASFRLAVGSAK